MTDGLYLYGIVAAPCAPLPEVAGVGGDVRTLQSEGLGAVVGAPPMAALADLSREAALRLLLSHQEVMEGAHSVASILPIKFGTVAQDERAVFRALQSGREIFSNLLAGFAGCSQYEIAVTWPLEGVIAEIAAEPAIAEAREYARLAGGQEAAIRVGQAVAASLARRRDAFQAQLLDRVGAVAMNAAPNAIMNDRMAANIAALVGNAERTKLLAAIEALDSDFGGRLTFRVVGPLPPASFATVHIEFISAAQIESAKEMLGLTGALSHAAIMGAFRLKAREIHPDSAGEDAEGAERLSGIKAAQKLLISCVDAAPEASSGDDSGRVAIKVMGAGHQRPLPEQRDAA